MNQAFGRWWGLGCVAAAVVVPDMAEGGLPLQGEMGACLTLTDGRRERETERERERERERGLLALTRWT